MVTSPDSRAFHDVIARLKLQWPLVKVIVAGTSVQGEGCADEIVFALDIVNRMTDADVILLVRGGGSVEELAGFNDERLARAVFASRIPVITGIGHELDYTIVEFVADHRAATPTAAAAEAVPNGPAIVSRNRDLAREMVKAIRTKVAVKRQTVRAAERALLRDSPTHRVRTRRQRLDELFDRLEKSTNAELVVRRRRLDALSRHLVALDPVAILSRGYALLTDADSGQLVTSVSQAHAGRELKARVKDGVFRATVRTEG